MSYDCDHDYDGNNDYDNDYDDAYNYNKCNTPHPVVAAFDPSPRNGLSTALQRIRTACTNRNHELSSLSLMPLLCLTCVKMSLFDLWFELVETFELCHLAKQFYGLNVSNV